MFSIAICDNSRKDSANIETIVKSYMHSKRIPYRLHKFKSGEELLEFHDKIDVIFLDIAMDGINGIQVGKRIHKINKNIKIVFTTNFEQYCMQAFNKVHAFAFLEKPILKDMAEKQLDEVIQYVQDENSKKKYINFEIIEITKDGKLENRIKNFDATDILYFEYLNRKIKIKLEEEEYFFIDKMKDVAVKMQDHNFEICHQCYLVNLGHIKRIKGYEVLLDNDETLPVSQKKSADFRKKLNKFIQKAYR